MQRFCAPRGSSGNRWAMKYPLIAVLALVGSVSALAETIEAQTDWSGGPDLFGPVDHWADRFLTADGIAWRSIPGQVALSCTPLGQPVETVIAPDADHPRTCAVGDIDGEGDTDHVDLGILLADWGCGVL